MILPPEIYPLFYRYRADQLDTVQHKALIIPTVLEDGSVGDWEWLFVTYGWNTIRDWIANPVREISLSPRVEWFWTSILLDHPRETPRWQGGNHVRVVPPDALPSWWPHGWR